MRLYAESNNELSRFVPWVELTPERQEQIITSLNVCLDREREEVRYLRALLLSNGGRNSDEINNILRG